MEYRLYTLGKDGKYYRYGNLCFNSATANRNAQKPINAGYITMCVIYDCKYPRRRIKAWIDGETYYSKYFRLDEKKYAEGIHLYVMENAKDYYNHNLREIEDEGEPWTETEWALNYSNNSDKLAVWLYQHGYINLVRKTGTD